MSHGKRLKKLRRNDNRIMQSTLSIYASSNQPQYGKHKYTLSRQKAIIDSLAAEMEVIDNGDAQGKTAEHAKLRCN